MITFDENTRLLILTPHADDEAIGCSGLIKKIKDHGGSVYVLLATLGETKKYGADSKLPESVRKMEFNAAMDKLQVNDWGIMFEDNEKHLRLDGIPRLELLKIIEATSDFSLEKIRPNMMAVTAPSFNQDHEHLYEAAVTACRPPVPGKKHVPDLLLTYEYPAISWSSGKHSFSPNFYLDISRELQHKLDTVSLYQSQLGESEYSISVDAVEIMAKYRGREISVDAAEAYEIKRIITR